MTKRDPDDPDGEYEGHNCTREDCYCAQEGWSQVETQDDMLDGMAEKMKRFGGVASHEGIADNTPDAYSYRNRADITTLGDDTCAGEFKRESIEDALRTSIADLTEAINMAGRQAQYLIDMKRDLASHLNMLTDARNGPRSTF